MRSTFPGYFRPTPEEFAEIWGKCLFAFDANVLLNLYRYSHKAQEGLVDSIMALKDRIFLPHQAAREFLKNRLSVTASQAEEYNRAIRQINDLVDLLSSTKKHPFLPDGELPTFRDQAARLCEQLESQKSQVLQRLTSDPILDEIESLFSDCIGGAFDDAKLKILETEGLLRYQNEVPPGYRDGKKDASGDPYRKFGDLIVWKQIIEKAKESAVSIVFVTDDLKDDWWLEQSGRTIGPRPELIEEFLAETGQKFWMYSVDKFLEESARYSRTQVSQAVLAEVIEVQADSRERADVEAVAEEIDSESNLRRPNEAFMKPMQPSEELAAIVGSEPLPRTEVVSKLWAYIKANGLQDKANKRIVNADEKLFAIFQKSSVSMFEMAGLIGKHVK